MRQPGRLGSGQSSPIIPHEATSALDNRTLAVVTASLARLQVTRVVMAHRLSTIQTADRIYVLAGGRVVQQAGLFAQLMARQASEDHTLW